MSDEIRPFSKDQQTKRLSPVRPGELSTVKKSPAEALSVIRERPRDPYDLRISDRVEIALSSGDLTAKDRRDLDCLLRAKYGKRIGFEADELSEVEEETVFPAAIVAFMAGVCEYLGSDFHPEYKNLVDTIGDALRDHSYLSKITIEELIVAKRDLAQLPREELPIAYNNRLDPPEFIAVLEKIWKLVRGKRLGRIEAKLRDDYKTEEDRAEEASRKELEERQIAAAQGAVSSPTLARHLSGKAALEEAWATFAKLHREDEAFQSDYVRRIQRILLDDLDRVAAYVDECFPRLPKKYEARAAELAFRQMNLGEEAPEITTELLERIGKIANRIRLSFKVWRWLDEGFLKLPPEPIVR